MIIIIFPQHKQEFAHQYDKAPFRHEEDPITGFSADQENT